MVRNFLISLRSKAEASNSGADGVSEAGEGPLSSSYSSGSGDGLRSFFRLRVFFSSRGSRGSGALVQGRGGDDASGARLPRALGGDGRHGARRRGQQHKCRRPKVAALLLVKQHDPDRAEQPRRRPAGVGPPVEHDERVGLTLFRLLATRTGEAMLEDMSGYFDADGDLTAPVPEAGTYLLEVDASSRSGDFALRIARE